MLLKLLVVFATFCVVYSIPADMRADDIQHMGAAVFGKPSAESGRRLENWNIDDGMNPEELGEYIEGDILMTKSMGRNALVAETAKWPGGVVPYEINGNFNGQDRKMIQDAINAYHEFTCIKFKPRESGDADWLSIVNGKTGCWSSVGRIGGRQELNLQSHGCLTKIGTPIHEFMHALGFVHEQNRWERDNFVQINFQNIMANRENNFAKSAEGSTNGHGVDYDFDSVLHYSDKAFSKNGLPTIQARGTPTNIHNNNNGFMEQVMGIFGWNGYRKNNGNHVMGQRDGFSQGDLIKIRRMYCDSREVRA